MNQYERIKQGERGAWLSILIYLFLAAMKIIIAQLANSQALRADGLNNATDVVAAVSILIGLKIARKPPDDNHHYGHFRAELIASLVASFIMVTVGLQVITNSFQFFWTADNVQPSMLAGWTALGSALIMFVVYGYNRKLAKQVRSQSLEAASQDNRADALVSLAAFLGISGAQFGLTWLDPLAGMIVGILIIYTAWKIFRDTSVTLTDGFEDVSVAKIRRFIEMDPEIIRVEDVKGRHDGKQTYLDLIIHVDPHMTVDQAHKITDRVEKVLQEKFDAHQTHIHVEPDPHQRRK